MGRGFPCRADWEQDENKYSNQKGPISLLDGCDILRVTMMPCSVPRRIQNVMVFAVIVLESEDDGVVLCPRKEISGTFV